MSVKFNPIECKVDKYRCYTIEFCKECVNSDEVTKCRKKKYHVKKKKVSVTHTLEDKLSLLDMSDIQVEPFLYTHHNNI
jgi:hypothetical protein